MWIEDQNEWNVPLSQLVIMKKAKSLSEKLKQQEGDSSTMGNFTATRGCLERFKHRRNLHSVKMTGETASADMQAADEFSTNLQAITECCNYLTQLVFNVDETGLFWKRMPSRTFIASEEKSASVFKAAKDRLTPLLGGNAAGDFK